MTNNSKSKTVQAVVQTATQFSTKPQENTESSNGNSTTNILKGQKRAKIGFSTVGDLTAPAAAAATKQQKRQQKMAKQQRKGTKAVQTFWKVKSGGVFFTQQQEQGGPNAGSQTQKN